MQNVQIEIVNGVFHLLDDNGAIVFFGDDWQEVEDFVYGDYNIQYQPKDLKFDVGSDGDDGPYGPYVYFDVKYTTEELNLTRDNFINLPSFLTACTTMEGRFRYDETMSVEQVVYGLEAVGATYEQMI